MCDIHISPKLWSKKEEVRGWTQTPAPVVDTSTTLRIKNSGRQDSFKVEKGVGEDYYKEESNS